MNATARGKRNPAISKSELADLRKRASAIRDQLKDRSGPKELLSVQELADSAPFYLELRGFVLQLKAAREAAGFTLAQVAEKCGLAEETLCRLESGAVTNPTWRTLGLYAAAVNHDVSIVATPSEPKRSGSGRRAART